MPAYVIVDTDVTDQTRYDEYRQLSGASVTAYNGGFIMRRNYSYPKSLYLPEGLELCLNQP